MDDRTPEQQALDLRIGRKLLARRTELGLCREEVAAGAALDVHEITALEEGRRTITTREWLALSTTLNRIPSWFIGPDD